MVTRLDTNFTPGAQVPGPSSSKFHGIQERPNSPAAATVYLVEDDPGIRDSLVDLLQRDGYRVESSRTAASFFDSYRPEAPGCVILDLCLPDANGLSLFEDSFLIPIVHPVIFMSGKATVQLAVQAMRAGAMQFLQKPFPIETLIASIEESLVRDRQQRIEQATRSSIRNRLAKLTEKERQVLHWLTQGVPNQEIANTLGISLRTVHSRRTRLMEKLGVSNRSALIRLVMAADNPPEFSPTRGSCTHQGSAN